MFFITFPGIWKWLTEQTSPAGYSNGLELFDMLFGKYLHDNEIYYMSPRIGQFSSGEEPIPMQMVRAYWKDNMYMDALAEAIGKNLYPVFINLGESLEQLRLAVEWDDGLPEQWREDLLESYATKDKERICQWLAKVIKYAIAPRENPKAKKSLRLVSIGCIPKPCRWFVGREDELEKIGELLRENKNVFLHGIAGIGKSELAKKFVDENGKKYSAVLWISCRGSLWQSITEMKTALDKPEEDMQARFHRHLEKLQRLPERGLLILDNCGCLPGEAKVLDEILRCRCHVLVTTRTYDSDRVNLEVKELEEEHLISLMKKLRKSPEAPEGDLRNLIQLLHGHTFAVELAARLTMKDTPSPGVLCWMLKAERFARKLMKKKVGYYKDDGKERDSYYNTMHSLFALMTLDSQKQWLMRNMTLMPERGVYQDNLVGLLRLPNDEQVEELEEMGLLRWDEHNAVVQMLPMVREITLTDLRPSISSCQVLANTIAEQCGNYGTDYAYYVLLFEITDQIIAQAQKDDLNLYWELLCNVFNYMEKVQWHPAMCRIFDEIERLANEAHLSPHCFAEYLDMKACLENDANRKVELEEKALALLAEIGEGGCALAGNIRNNLGCAHRMAKKNDAAIAELEGRLNQLNTGKNEYQRYDYIACAANLAVAYSEMGQFGKALGLLEPMERELRKLGQTFCAEYGMVLESLGTVRLIQGRLFEAKSLYRDAMLVWEVCHRNHPELIQQKAAEYKVNCIRYLLSSEAKDWERLEQGIIRISEQMELESGGAE